VGDASHTATVASVCREQGLRLERYDHAEALLEASPQVRCVLLCSDDSGPGSSGSEIALLNDAGAGPILVLCERLRPWELRAALQAGASGVILRSEVADTLGPCLEATLSGQVCIPRMHASEVEPPALSNREKQVLGLVVMGHTNGEIADRLFLAESTVKSHLSSAFGKLGVRSRHEAVELILDSERGFGAGILGLSVEQVV
jgi:DNA-binding NarL/FixJ family response regulator